MSLWVLPLIQRTVMWRVSELVVTHSLTGSSSQGISAAMQEDRWGCMVTQLVFQSQFGDERIGKQATELVNLGLCTGPTNYKSSHQWVLCSLNQYYISYLLLWSFTNMHIIIINTVYYSIETTVCNITIKKYEFGGIKKQWMESTINEVRKQSDSSTCWVVISGVGHDEWRMHKQWVECDDESLVMWVSVGC